MKGTVPVSRLAGAVENVKAPPVCMGVASPPATSVPAPRRKQSPGTLSGAVALCCCWVFGLEKCRQMCPDFDHPIVYGDIADLNGGGNLPLGHALYHTAENDFVLAVQSGEKLLHRCPNGGGSLGVGGCCGGIKEAIFFAATIGGRVADYHAVPLLPVDFPLECGFRRSADDSRQTVGKALTGPSLDVLRQLVNIQQFPGNQFIGAIDCIVQLVTVGQPPLSSSVSSSVILALISSSMPVISASASSISRFSSLIWSTFLSSSLALIL